MERMYDHAKDQERWNEYGKKLAKNIEENLEKFIIDKDIFLLPQRLYKQEIHDFMDILGMVKGKKILELGWGSGKLAVFLSKLGAEVTAIDIGFDLVYASRALSKANNISCNFQQANIKKYHSVQIPLI